MDQGRCLVSLDLITRNSGWRHGIWKLADDEVALMTAPLLSSCSFPRATCLSSHRSGPRNRYSSCRVVWHVLKEKPLYLSVKLDLPESKFETISFPPLAHQTCSLRLRCSARAA